MAEKGSKKIVEGTVLRRTNLNEVLIEESPIMMVAFNAEKRILMINRAMRDKLGYSEGELMGRDYLSTFVPREEWGLVNDNWDKLIELKGPAINENHVISKDGRRFLVEWHGRFIMKEDGVLDFFFGMGIDITKRKKAEFDLKEAFSEIKRLKDRLEAENIYLRQEMKVKQGSAKIIGQSAEIKKTLILVDQVASTESTVLIQGETGTGKELIVEALHYGGSRAKGPLIKVNSSALSETILESELFGHVKGAFSGALSEKIGRFQAAEGGSIFLDEIGEISPRIQVKLLRFLETKEYERVGESKTRKADVRIITATNADLEKSVMEGTFRADLFYRLNIITIHLPPLRERIGDIPLLLNHFIKIYSKQFKKKIKGVNDDVMEIFLDYHWPGNIRELKHAIEHACLICGDIIISMDNLPKNLKTAGPLIAQIEDPSVINPGQIIEALKKASWKKAKAARILGIHRSTLYRMMDRYKISPSDYQ